MPGVWPRLPRPFRSRRCSGATRASSPAGSASAWPSGGPSSATRRSFCSTSRSPTSTPRSECGCAWRSRGFRDRLDATMVYVTHDQTEAMTLADRIVVINHGRIEQVGAPEELYDAPANRFVAGFIGAPAMNFIPRRDRGDRRDESRGCGSARCRCRPGVRTTWRRGRLRWVFVRSTCTSPPRPRRFPRAGRDRRKARRGVAGLSQTEFSAEPVTIRISEQPSVQPGDEVPVRVGWDRFHLFRETGAIL